MSRGPKRENFYRRDPGAALAGMANMSLEERGVYNTLIDLMYLTWRPIEDNRAYIAGHCGCAVQKLNPILRRLIEKRKLIRFEIDGQGYISNARFDAERAAVKGVEKASDRGEVGEKSPGVGEKSASVEENVPLLDHETEENQPPTALEKSRVDKTRVSDAYASSVAEGDGERDFEDLWKAYPHVRGRSSKPKAKAGWLALDPELRPRLPRAAQRYKSGGTIPQSGAPALAKWLADELWRDWMDEPAAEPEPQKSQVIDYAEVRERIQREVAAAAGAKAIGAS